MTLQKWQNLFYSLNPPANGWVRQNGGVDLTMGGGSVIFSKVILVPQKILNKTSTC